MLHLMSNAGLPVRYVSSGNLFNQNGFIHQRRTLDSFVFILVLQGTLHMNLNGSPHDIGPNQFLMLFPDQEHFGCKPSEGLLSYYWVHFYLDDLDYKYYHPATIQRYFDFWNADPQSSKSLDYYILAEHGSLSPDKRVNLLFVQLLDLARRENFNPSFRCHYALSLLLLEVSQESLASETFLVEDIPSTIVQIIEWIRANYEQDLTVQGISDQFNYNPTYLSSVFKKYTGYPLLNYINRTRITISKNLLTNRELSIWKIAAMCGFEDEKYFMKLFKKCEGLTPTQYRDAFYKTRINKV